MSVIVLYIQMRDSIRYFLLRFLYHQVGAIKDMQVVFLALYQHKKKKMKQTVALVFGGKSAEHDVSLISASTIYKGIDRTKFDVVLLGNDKEGKWFYNEDCLGLSIDLVQQDYFSNAKQVYLQEKNSKGIIVDAETHTMLTCFDLVFPMIHGTFGEDGTLQGYLRFLGIPFAGSAVVASAICMDKEMTKRVLRDAGLPITRFIVLSYSDRKKMSFDCVVQELGLPIFVKPCNAGSSIGVSKVATEEDFRQALILAFSLDKKVLIEEAIQGKEIECAILGNEHPIPSILGEIVPLVDFYSYDVKYGNTDTVRMKIPAEITSKVSDEMRDIAIKAYQVTGCEGFARVDFFLKEDGCFLVNEINTLPGFTCQSMYPKLFEYAGISLTELLTSILMLAIAKYKRT